MLKLSLTPGEYITIGEDVVVQLYHMEGGRSYLAVKAPREIPILRGTVAERSGAKRPDGLANVTKGHRTTVPI